MEQVLNEYLKDRKGIHVAVGLDVGKAFVTRLGKKGRRVGICFGPEVSAAEWLQLRTGAKQVRISEEVYDQLNDEDVWGEFTQDGNTYVATGLTHHLAIEWASRGIRVNAVAPGTIRTDAVVSLLETPEGQAYIEEIEQRHPIGRLGEPREVAEAIAFLASDSASFVTGAVLPVDGGYLAQ